MGNNSVVSIRVEALGVSIAFRIADGGVAVEQTKTEIPAAVPKVKSAATASREALPEPHESPVQVSSANIVIPGSTSGLFMSPCDRCANIRSPKKWQEGTPG